MPPPQPSSDASGIQEPATEKYDFTRAFAGVIDSQEEKEKARPKRLFAGTKSVVELQQDNGQKTVVTAEVGVSPIN